MEPMLREPDRKALTEIIQKVESQTAGEIVVHVAGRSDTYAARRMAVAGALALLCVEVASFFVEGLHPWALELAVPVFGLLYLLFGVGPVLRVVVPASAREAAVDERAALAFLEHNVHATRDASGVLVFVSLLERRVEVLADQGIHARVGVDGWKAHVDEVVQGIRSGDLAAGLRTAIEHIGRELAEAFPPRQDDSNELSNVVAVTED